MIQKLDILAPTRITLVACGGGSSPTTPTTPTTQTNRGPLTMVE